jgi:CRP-like cAMP-binding protein
MLLRRVRPCSVVAVTDNWLLLLLRAMLLRRSQEHAGGGENSNGHSRGGCAQWP